MSILGLKSSVFKRFSDITQALALRDKFLSSLVGPPVLRVIFSKFH